MSGTVRSRGRTLALLLQPRIPSSFWISNTLEGIRRAAARHGDEVCPLTPGQLAQRGSQAPVLLIGNSLDWLERTVVELLGLGIHPIVINACMIPGYQNRCSSVVFAVEDGVRELVAHMRCLGRRRMVMLGALPMSAADRIKAEAFGSPGDVIWADGRLDDSIRSFAERLPGLDCDACLCVNDTAAICLIRALDAMGFDWQGRVAISGMGNSFLGQALRVPLTSVDFDYAMLGRQAVELWHSLLSDPEPRRESRALPCRLIVRASTGTSCTHPLSAPDPDALPPFDAVTNALYYAGPESSRILALEACFQACRSTDREILYALMRGMSCERIAETLFFTPRAIRYRIRRLTGLFGFSSREELLDALRSIAGICGN